MTSNEKNMSSSPHIPVLLQEVIEWSNLKPGGLIVDATVGFGGHAEALIPQILPGGRYLGIDKDDNAISFCESRLEKFGSTATIINGYFSEIDQIVKKENIAEVDLVLFDLGLSSYQVDEAQYGISFKIEGDLDMRIGSRGDESAADILNHWSGEELKRLFTKHGQPATNRLVKKIIEDRKKTPFKRISQLVSVIESTVPKKPGLHPATLVFQALRVAVNKEEEELERGLEQAVSLLKEEGRLLVISFHSGEDGVVKRFMQKESKGCICPTEYPVCVCGHKPILEILTKKPIAPSKEEVVSNPRSRSARLRVAIKRV